MTETLLDRAVGFREVADRPGPWRGMRRLAAAIGASRGWRRIGLALALGALATLAMPPVYGVPALVPAFVGLVWLLDGARGRWSAAVTGFFFALGHMATGFYWVANALLTKPEEFGWVAPLAPIALAAILAPWPALACVVARSTLRSGVGRVLVLAGAWTIAEWVRSWIYTGFPWNLVGSVWAFSDGMLQAASLVGAYGMGLATVAAAAMPAVLVLPAPTGRRRWRPVFGAFLVLLGAWAFGEARLAVIGPVGVVEGVRLRLVQGNIPQTLKWQAGLVDAHIRDQIELAETPADPPPTAVLWSEAAAPLFLSRDPERLLQIGRSTPPGGLSLVGTLRTTARGVEPFQVWNSMLAIDPEGRIEGSYDKAHLVPFGEYMPFRQVLGLGSIAGGMTDLSSGDGVHTLRLPGLPPMGPLVCYEVIFPGEVVDGNDRPDWLYNLTNDGWYGISAGPYQHLVAARLRAVEEGLPVVRVANTGISAIIDPTGRVVAELGLDRRGVVDGSLPLPLPRTLFAVTGPWGAMGLALFMVVLGFAWGGVLRPSRRK